MSRQALRGRTRGYCIIRVLPMLSSIKLWEAGRLLVPYQLNIKSIRLNGI